MTNDYFSSIESSLGAVSSTLNRGKGKGMSVTRLFNGKISLELLEDRCLDIFRCEFKGENYGFISKAGLVSAHLAFSGAFDFVSSFPGGFLYTCGLDNIGAPHVENGKTVVQHGTLSIHPCESVNVTYGSDENGNFIVVEGYILDSALFGENLKFTRKITLYENAETFKISDIVENLSAQDAKIVLLHHFNLGYPLVSENVKISIPTEKVEGLNQKAKDNLSSWQNFKEPTKGEEEEVFYHTTPKNPTITCENGDRKISIKVDSPDKYVTMWKSQGAGDYVLGIEPTTSKLGDEKEFLTMKPGETLTFSYVIDFSKP